MPERLLRSEPDISIGQRLAAGFLALFLIALVVGLVVHLNQRETTQVRERYEQQVAPLAATLQELERSILLVALRMRAYFLEPEEANLQRYRVDMNKARAVLRELANLPKDGESADLFRDLESEVDNYLTQVGTMVSGVVAGTVESDTAERRLRTQREGALANLRQAAELQISRTEQALADIRSAQTLAARRLLATGVGALVLFIGFAVFTTRAVRSPARVLVGVARAMQAGNRKPALTLLPLTGRMARNEMLQLGAAFGLAADAIDRRERRLQADVEISGAAAASLVRREVAEQVLRLAASHVRAEVGVVYLWDEKQRVLNPLAAHALADDGLAPVRAGDGLPGQVAEQRQLAVLDDMPADSRFRIGIGYDHSQPRAAMAVPVLFGERLHGVVLLAALRNFDPEAPAFLRSVASQLAVSFENIAAYERVEELLDDVRSRNEQIQAQNEELQAQSEEIQTQSEEIQAQNEELQGQQEELQAQNEQLQLQSEELLEADRRKNEFLGVLAHELRNPLSSITGSLEILARSGPGSPPSESAVQIIVRQTRQLHRLIEDLLDITRISQGKIRLKYERFDLVGAVRSCIEDLQQALDIRQTRLVVNLPRTPVWIYGDSVRLCQVIGNLLGNALKFTDHGGRVSIQVRVEEGVGQRCVRVRVEDDGIGMSAELQERLFQPFSQGQAGLDRMNGGLGLGLALVKALVEQHGGRVEAYSQGEGHGSRFDVYLNVDSQREDEQAPAVVPKATQSVRILVIDDNVDAAYTLASLYTLAGHTVETAHDGSEGISRALTFGPDLVLCDIGLPEMDGYEVARRFRADERLRSVPLVALTGYAMAEDQRRALQAGFDRHEAKPLTLQRLSALLDELCGDD